MMTMLTPNKLSTEKARIAIVAWGQPQNCARYARYAGCGDVVWIAGIMEHDLRAKDSAFAV